MNGLESLGIMNQGENSNAIAWNGKILVRGLSDDQAQEFLKNGNQLLESQNNQQDRPRLAGTDSQSDGGTTQGNHSLSNLDRSTE